jgi:hypothetical protein
VGSYGNFVDVLSSKSENRFRVNFHTMKPTMQMTVIAPATDMPMIEPIPRPPLLLLEAGDVWDGLADAAPSGVAVTTIVCV